MAEFIVLARDDAEQVIAIVRREAGEECPHDHPLADSLDACAREAVRGLWDSRIKTFVPLLALRRVRACVQAGSCAPWVS